MSDWLEKATQGLSDILFDGTDQNREAYKKILASQFEAYAEMKAVQLKVALGRCYECFKQQALEMGNDHIITLPSDNFVDSLFEMFQ